MANAPRPVIKMPGTGAPSPFGVPTEYRHDPKVVSVFEIVGKIRAGEAPPDIPAKNPPDSLRKVIEDLEERKDKIFWTAVHIMVDPSVKTKNSFQ